MKARHSILLLSGLLCIAACSDNDNPAEPVSGESAVCALEAGTYCIEYDQINEFDNSIYNSWVLDDITVTNGSDQESSTAYVSTANAKQTDKTE